MRMNLKSKALLFSPFIIIPILLIGYVAADKLKQATEARLSTGIITLLDQISRHSFDAAFMAKENRELLLEEGDATNRPASEVEAMRRDMALDMASLKETVNSSAIGDTGYLVLIDASGEIVFFPKQVPLSSAENNLRLLGEKIDMEYDNMRTEINVDGHIVFAYWKELASGMHMVAFLPEDDVIKAGCELSKPVYRMTLAMVLFVVVSIFMFLRYLVLKPVDALNAAAEKISRGHLDVEIDTRRNDEIGQLSKYFYDVGKNLKQTREETSYLANHDSLTGLPNNTMFGDYLEKIIAIAGTKKHRVSLLFIKLSNLNQINVSYGQDGGDAVLKEMALRLNSSLRKNIDDDHDLQDKSYDMVARVAGNDFIVLLDKIDGASDAAVVSDRILKLLQKPVVVNNAEVAMHCSIGASIYPDDSLSARELVKNADIAMYRAKETGINHYQFYSDKTNTVMHEHIKIHSRLRNAIDGNQLFMNYQPRFDASSGDIAGIEALIRWQDPEEGLISPDVFIPIAEDSGLISEITKWVIHNVCTQAMAWYSSGRLTVPVSVNISGIEFKRFDLLAVVSDCLEQTELPANLLELEVSEASLLSESDQAIEIYSHLQKLGVVITVDNFGTGFSSVRYLHRLPVSTLKIDRSFVADIKSKNDDCAVVDAVIAQGHALGMSVVAVGVETEIQRTLLKSKNCDVMQGFLLSQPLSASDMTGKLDELQVADL
ncbi:MAG: EAL domain-containing protein [Gammaproteobacteria bacterium]|nr:EAL domain-containing protein [Gammaproteobacteria bacterium]